MQYVWVIREVRAKRAVAVGDVVLGGPSSRASNLSASGRLTLELTAAPKYAALGKRAALQATLGVEKVTLPVQRAKPEAWRHRRKLEACATTKCPHRRSARIALFSAGRLPRLRHHESRALGR
jgi:hypothetical protein